MVSHASTIEPARVSGSHEKNLGSGHPRGHQRGEWCGRARAGSTGLTVRGRPSPVTARSRDRYNLPSLARGSDHFVTSSLVVDEATRPAELEVTARAEDGAIMALQLSRMCRVTV
jgi:hypothetical protein